ncbi:MAG: translation initiation factor IF-2 [archaeon]|nr:MAG: translation initiation factor IF-2 [archaeon]
MTIRQPIVTVAGHVDHGKTTILDCVAGTCIAEKEPGLITQNISFMLIPSDMIQKKCQNLLDSFKIKLEVPGFLFIDTPGHAAFTNLRKRGGSLADLAILVIDINEGIMEQTRESIEILKASKVPFLVALNKLDKIPGWKKSGDSFKESLELQAQHTKQDFEKKLYKIIGDFVSLGFDADLFFRVSNFTKQLALVPCSGKIGEGTSELIVMLAGLAQRFLKKELELGKEAKGTILEVKKEKGMTEIEAVLYDGVLDKKDQLVVSTLSEPVVTKIRSLYQANPMKKGFFQVTQAIAASGLKICIPTEAAESVIPGMPFVGVKKEKELDKVKEELQSDIKKALEKDKEGFVVKAESLGSLEALVFLLRKHGYRIKKAEIGQITKQDITLAKVSYDKYPLDSVVIGFNVDSDLEDEKVKVISKSVIYHILEELEKWQKERELEIEREKLQGLNWPCKLFVMKNCCFRQSKPAIFGVRVEIGLLKPGTIVMNSENEEIAKVKGIQHETKSLEKAEARKEVAISLPGVTFGRQVRGGQILYSKIKEEEFKQLKENKKFLTQQEISLLQEIAEINRKAKPTWGI